MTTTTAQAAERAKDGAPPARTLQLSNVDELRLDALMERLRASHEPDDSGYTQIDGVLQIDTLIQHVRERHQAAESGE